MSAAKPNPILRLLPSLADVAFLMPLVFVFLRLEGARTLLGDGDTGWHIRTGEWILDNGRVPDRDIFSYTKAGEPWYAWEWLWDVGFGWLHRHGGMQAVVIVSLLVISLAAALFYRNARIKSGNPVLAIAVTVIAVTASSIHWLARPHLFTLLFVAVFYSILESARAGRTSRLLWLPFLTIPWVNLHGGFFIGAALAATYAAGEVARAATDADPGERRARWRRSWPYLAAAAGCLAASLVNPYGWRLHLHIVRYLTDPYHFRNIVEFFSMNFQDATARFFEAGLISGFVAAAWSIYQRRFTDALLVAGWAHLALTSVRNVPLFMFLAAPVIAQAANELLARLAQAQVAGWLGRAARALVEASSEFGSLELVRRAHVASALAVIALITLLYHPLNSSKLRAEYDPRQYPAGAIELLRNPQFSARVFTTDEWGDYLIYRLYPRVKVFIDGRSDFYGAKFGEEYIGLMQGKFSWADTLKRYAIRTVVLPVDASLASTLKEARGWRVIYDDGVAIVFHERAPETLRVSAVNAAEFSVIARSRTINQNHQSTRGE